MKSETNGNRQRMKNGNILIWYVIFAAWGTDIFAYFTGKAIGKNIWV